MLIVENRRTTSGDLHDGHGGTGLSEVERYSSYRSPHFSQRYSYTGMSSDLSPVPAVEELRALARALGIEPLDEDLEAAAVFLASILPALREIEESLPPETRPAALFLPEGKGR